MPAKRLVYISACLRLKECKLYAMSQPAMVIEGAACPAWARAGDNEAGDLFVWSHRPRPGLRRAE